MSSLSLIQKLASHSSRQTADFVHDRCLRKRLNTCECSDCRDVCPAGAISFRDRKISFDARACSGCMLCASACPNDAFTFSGFDPDSLCSPNDNPDLVLISCTRQRQIYPQERLVPCLGGIATEHLLALNVGGESVLAFNVSSCADCQNQHGVTNFLRRLAWLKHEAGDIFKRKYIIITDEREIVALDRSIRRSFLSGLKESLYETIASQFSFQIQSSRPVAKASRRTPARVQVKKQLMKGAASKDRQALSRLINHRLIINEACNRCPLCTGICPTGALKIKRNKENRELRFDATLCSGCGLCVSFCRQNALSLKRPDAWIATAGAGSQPRSPEAFLPLVKQAAELSELGRA
jgi:ferredoxin